MQYSAFHMVSPQTLSVWIILKYRQYYTPQGKLAFPASMLTVISELNLTFQRGPLEANLQDISSLVVITSIDLAIPVFIVQTSLPFKLHCSTIHTGPSIRVFDSLHAYDQVQVQWLNCILSSRFEGTALQMNSICSGCCRILLPLLKDVPFLFDKISVFAVLQQFVA